jgi:hypothetical protein
LSSTGHTHGSLTALTALGIIGTAFELATLKHWNGTMQLVPWAALVVLAGALAVHAGRSGRTFLVRALAMLVLLTSLYGVLEHALVNYDSGPLDQRFADRWDALSPWLQWWYAITRTVGPAPTLAPGMLGQAALTLMLATVGPRSASTEPLATRHRRHPCSSRFSHLTYARNDTYAPSDGLVAAAATGATRRVSDLAPNRHRRPRW